VKKNCGDGEWFYSCIVFDFFIRGVAMLLGFSIQN
jgi:hypothetical protein